ncbi:slit homolog 1 protein-like [Uloborus diversus]|uniref:slit homolog 1 protein-like n=1 Tax=Uloborus diversus TaxID=327109 RepID=UPI00240A62F1|nr:slit homolog 1 protein-like [Uloborus diversus]
MTLPKLTIILCLVFLVVDAVRTCPPEETLRPCTCKNVQDSTGEDFPIISCNGLQSEDALESAVRASKGFKIFELKLIESSLRYIPQDAFVGTSFEVLCVENSSLSSLSQTDVALRGLEDSLHLIEIFNSTFSKSWNWSQLARMSQLMEVLVHDSQLQEITDGISNIRHLEIQSFAFQRNNIERIDEFAFSPFTKLNRLTLDGNQLTEIKRTMLPMTANFLTIIGLSGNRIRYLPHDLFSYMPSLKSVYLSGNPLYTIEEVVFKPVWRQLHLLLFSGTPLSCDCRIAWITRQDNSNKYIHAECQNPSKLRGRTLSSLQLHELWC